MVNTTTKASVDTWTARTEIRRMRVEKRDDPSVMAVLDMFDNYVAHAELISSMLSEQKHMVECYRTALRDLVGHQAK